MHQIGVGVLGPVFRTYDPGGDRLVALKAFHLDITPEQAATLVVALKGIVQAAPPHPSIVTPVGAGLSDGVPFLAQEHVAAESLDVAIRHYAPAAVDMALPLVVQMAEALDAAHEQGLSHGALHLRDIFVMPELARVAGFGVVSALERVGLRGPLRRPYTAPEQIAGAEWGPTSDRFALAAIAYELLTGKRAGGTGKQVTDRLARVSDLNDATSLTRFFAAALADNPDARPRSARLLADQLADAVGWTGAGAVRQALVRMDGEAGDPEHPVSDDAPVIAVAGVSERPGAGVETTGTEGAALAMARTNGPESRPEDTFEWTERTLDRGEPDEFREPEAYQPRPVGAPREVETLPHRQQGAVPDFDRSDAAPDETVADGDGALPTLGNRRPSVEPRLPAHAAGSLLDQLEPEPDDDDVDPLIEARHAPGDVGSEASGAIPDTQAAGVYAAITPSDLPERPGGAYQPAAAADDGAYEYEDQPVEPESLDDDTVRDDGSFLVGADSGNEYDDYTDDEDDIQADVVASDRAGRSHELPVVPLTFVALLIAVAAFAVAFGWLGGDDRVATAEPVSSDTMAAGGLADAGEMPEPAPPKPQEFSDATVAEAASNAAPVGPEPAPPIVEPVPSEAEIDASARPERPDTNDEPAPIAPIVPEPTPQTASGRLLVRTTPPGVAVVVNGVVRGTTPLTLGGLPYGAHDVRLTLEGYEPQERHLAISSDDPIAAISADLAGLAETRTASLGVGSISVDTRPRGVEVWLDQRLVGETPMLIPNVPTGAHEVEFRHDGYRTWATTVQVGPSGQARVTASLDHAGR